MILIFQLYPVVFVMLMIQSHETYKNVFSSIKREEPLWKPKTVICDSEKTLSEILMHVFPNAVVAGSWFCYNQVGNIEIISGRIQ